MSKEKKKKSYIVGPFKQAMENAETFGVNMYYSYYYQNAIEEIASAESIEVEEGTDEKSKYYDEILKLISEIQSGVEQNGVD
jgi:delta-aminolevulinic acid dehydratase/porphobilinogen synthase